MNYLYLLPKGKNSFVLRTTAFRNVLDDSNFIFWVSVIDIYNSKEDMKNFFKTRFKFKNNVFSGNVEEMAEMMKYYSDMEEEMIILNWKFDCDMDVIMIK